MKNSGRKIKIPALLNSHFAKSKQVGALKVRFVAQEIVLPRVYGKKAEVDSLLVEEGRGSTILLHIVTYILRGRGVFLVRYGIIKMKDAGEILCQ